MRPGIGRLFWAAGAINADPVGPNACPSNITPYEWDAVKGWWGVTWTNGDSTAYTQFSEDGGSSVSHTAQPGVSSYTPYWTASDLSSGLLKMRHFKNGVEDSCSWQTIESGAA